MTTPREALGELNLDFHEIGDILTAFAPYLIPEGCVAVCPARHCDTRYDYQWCDCTSDNCPLRKATP